MFLSKEERLHQYYVFPTKVLCQIENCEKFEIFFCFCCCLEDLKQLTMQSLIYSYWKILKI